MKFYLPVGPRGWILKLSMVATGVMGAVVYWRASRRRGAAMLIASHPPVLLGRPAPTLPPYPSSAL